jgi:two-component system, chemotaxis family, CheB/CheR fusion protein
MHSENPTDSLRSELASIVETTDDAIIGKDLNGTITSWNKGAERLYGYSAAEAVGQHISLISPQDRADEIVEIMRRVRLGEKLDHYETIRRTKDGRLLNISLTISPIHDSRGKLKGASAIGRDITEAKCAEAALRLSERLATVGRLAATITHEINNPLESIGNVLDLLSQRDLSADDSTLVHYAQEELRRVMQIVRQTLAFNRVVSFPAEFIVKDVMDDVLDMYQRKIQKNRLTVERRYEFTGKILAHAVEFRQVFANLVRNAVEATAPDGQLLIVLRASRSWKDPKTAGVRIAVIDNGAGIPEDIRRQVFNPFFSTKEEQGTGLGLWVSRQIVARHGGSIRFRTRVGRGTCFTVFLPFRPPNRDLGSEPVTQALSA